MEFIYYLCLSIFTLFITKLCFNLKHKNLPPSPLSLPVIGHLHLLKRPLYRSLQTLTDKYGPIIFLKFGARPVLVISSPSAVDECFAKNDTIFANRVRSIAGDHLSYNYTALGWAPYGHHWRSLRRIATIETFSAHSLQMSAYIRHEEVMLSIHSLFHSTKGGSYIIDLNALFSELSFNVIMKSIAGKRCFDGNMTKEEKKRKLVNMKETFVPSMTMELSDFFPALRRVCFRGVEDKMVRLHKAREIFHQDLIDERRRTCNNEIRRNKCLVDNLLALQESDPEQYSDDIIKGLITIFLTAGTETTASTMEWAMSLLVNHPEVLSKASYEIETSIPHGRLLDESDLPKLSYLNAIINETLRLYPVAPLLIPHFSSEDCTVGGYNVLSGTMLIANAKAIHKDPKLWIDPDRFLPERFEGGVGQKIEGFKFIPFGLGRRSCPGSGLATRMIGLTLGTLIQCFEWERVGVELIEMSERSGVTMPKANPLVVVCKLRQSMVDVLFQTFEG